MTKFYTAVEKFGNNILFRGYDNGKPIKQRIWFKPSLFVPSNQPSKYKSLDGKTVGKIDFESMKDAQEFARKHGDISNFQVHGQSNYVIQFIGEYFGNKSTFDRDLINVTTIDIEVQSDKGFPQPDEAKYPITAITIKNNIDGIFYVWGLGDYDKSKTIIEDAAITYVKCKDEYELLFKFLDHWSNNYPDCLTGWNSRLFDTVYIVNRIGQLLGEDQVKKLSPWGIIQRRDIKFGLKELMAYDIKGIQQLDYYDLFKKFGYSYGTQESYKLDSIANVVLGEKKLDYSEYASLTELYLNDHQKFIDYNIKDVQIVDRLEDKMGLITLCMTVAYRAGVNIVDAFGSVGVWDAFIYNELKSTNVVVPPKVAGVKDIQIEGAYVKDPQVGLHKWVCSFDLNSLYPHLMMQYNMSPETIVDQEIPDVTVDHLLDEDEYEFPEQYCMSGRGNLFRKDKRGIVPEIIDKLYEERSLIKKEMLDVSQDKEQNTDASKHEMYVFDKQINTLNNRQMAIKILMNSLYGAMANNYFRYYDQRIAESITMSGQLTIRWAEKIINKYLNKILKTNNVDYIIAIDTDSLYVNLNGLVTKVYGENPDTDKVIKFIDSVAKEKFEPILEQAYERLATYMNAYEQKMVMAREVIADKGVWTGKKHYVLNVHNSEGVQYSEPKLKIMGIEAVRSSTPMVCRTLIKDTISLILNTDETTVQQFIAQKREWFATLTPEEVAFPRGVNLEKTVKDEFGSASLLPYQLGGKSLPIHVRGTLLFNSLLKKHKISTKYQQVYSGEKIKFVYLNIPNPIRENVIAFSQMLPPEFDLHRYINYELQFNKAYLDPINNILSAIGWCSEKQNTIEDFFI